MDTIDDLVIDNYTEAQAPGSGCEVWIGSLHAYNCGNLIGEWIALDGIDRDDLQERIDAILLRGGNPGGDWAIMDYSGFDDFAALLGENPDLDNLLALAELIEEHGIELVSAAGDVISGCDVDDLRAAIEERYRGKYDDLEDFAAELLEEFGELESIPERLRYYFDYKAYARDLEIGGDVNTVRKDGGLYVFWTS